MSSLLGGGGARCIRGAKLTASGAEESGSPGWETQSEGVAAPLVGAVWLGQLLRRLPEKRGALAHASLDPLPSARRSGWSGGPLRIIRDDVRVRPIGYKCLLWTSSFGPCSSFDGEGLAQMCCPGRQEGLVFGGPELRGSKSLEEGLRARPP